MNIYKNEIKNRQKKKWFESEKEKKAREKIDRKEFKNKKKELYEDNK
jgi:hypothetical protein